MLQTPSITLDGVPVSLPFKRADALLYYMLVQRSATRQELIALLWENRDEATGLKNLRNTLYALKKALGGDFLLSPQKSLILINRDWDVDCDYDRFTQQGDFSAYQGPFLQGFAVKHAFSFDEWVGRTREKLHGRYLSHLAQQAREAHEAGDEEEAIRVAVEYLQDEPFDEEMAAFLMRRFQGAHKYSKAAQVYQKLKEQLLEELLAGTPAQRRLLAALDTLETALRELNFSHNNLRAGNLRWSGGRFVPLRYHDAHFGPSGDGAAFESLREQVRRTADPMCVGDTEAVYTPHRRLTGHRWTSHVFEGLVCVEDDEGFGFVDTENNPVIRPQYTWAGDFREGRAEVETPSGMGLIDRQGRYVIPPEYEIVDYAPAESIVRVRKDGRWAEFDYLGRRLTEFGTNND